MDPALVPGQSIGLQRMAQMIGLTGKDVLMAQAALTFDQQRRLQIDGEGAAIAVCSLAETLKLPAAGRDEGAKLLAVDVRVGDATAKGLGAVL